MALASAAPQRQQRPAPYGPPPAYQSGPPYSKKAPVYRDEMPVYERQEAQIPVYREQEKQPEKRQAAYGPAAPAYVEKELPPQPFQYEYGVKDDYSGNAFAKTESQNEAGQVQGSYKVNLPDGRIQTVTYRADHEGGFVAEVSLGDVSTCGHGVKVTYEGEPQYPPPPPGGYGPYKVGRQTKLNPTIFPGTRCLPRPSPCKQELVRYLGRCLGISNIHRTVDNIY